MIPVVKTCINGLWDLNLPKHRADRPEWYTPEGWERARLNGIKGRIDRVQDRCQRPARVLYIGAEVGEMPALCAKWGSSVLMAEPNERVHPTIRSVWESNDLPFNGMYTGFCGKEDSSNHKDGWNLSSWPKSCYEEMVPDHGFKELCDPGGRPVITVDTMCEQYNNWDGFAPDIITMDVEGAEWEVLQGCEHILNIYHPTLFISLHPEMLVLLYDKWSYEVRKWMVSRFGYSETLLQYEHEAHFMYEILP